MHDNSVYGFVRVKQCCDINIVISDCYLSEISNKVISRFRETMYQCQLLFQHGLTVFHCISVTVRLYPMYAMLSYDDGSGDYSATANSIAFVT